MFEILFAAAIAYAAFSYYSKPAPGNNPVPIPDRPVYGQYSNRHSGYNENMSANEYKRFLNDPNIGRRGTDIPRGHRISSSVSLK